MYMYITVPHWLITSAHFAVNEECLLCLWLKSVEMWLKMTAKA